MGRRIVPTIQNRTEDFLKMDSLHYLADQNGLAIMSFTRTETGWVVSYLDKNKYAGKEPKREYMRDMQDYYLAVAQVISLCTIRSAPYPQFQDMVMGEIQRLKSLPL